MEKEIKPVIVAVGYNRVHSLQRLLESVEKAYYEDAALLIISIDHGGSEDVLKFADEFHWSHGTKIVRTFEENQGLCSHLMQCIDYSVEYGAAIILEDDLYVSPYFYLFTKSAVNYYKNDPRIFEIALFSARWNVYANRKFEPVYNGMSAYAIRRNTSWGQCILGERWKEFRAWYENHEELESSMDLPEVILSWKNSWCKYVEYYFSKHDVFTIVPYVSYSTNFGDAGIHMGESDNAFQQPIVWGREDYRFGAVEELVQYDIFFESIALKELLKERYQKPVCIDYYGMRKSYAGYDLCLSSVLLPYEVVDQYGLDLKPYELNVIDKIAGNDIWIYDLHQRKEVKKNRKHHFRVFRYENGNLDYLEALFYLLYGKLKNKIFGER